MTPPRSLARNFLALALSRAVQIASGFFVLLAVARGLPLDAYGTYASVTALAGAVAAMTYFGIQQIMIREMAAMPGRGPAIVGQALVLRLGMIALSGVVLAVVAVFASYGPEARLGLALAFCLEASRSLTMLGCAVFQAHERMGYEPPLSIVSGLASVALVGAALLIVVSLNQRRGPIRERLAEKPYGLRYALIAALALAILVLGAYGIGYDSSQFIYNQF